MEVVIQKPLQAWLFLSVLPLGACIGSPEPPVDLAIDPGMLTSALDTDGKAEEQQPTDLAQEDSTFGKDSVTFQYRGLHCQLHYLERQDQYLGVATGQIPPTSQTYYLFDSSGSLLSTDEVGWRNLSPTLTMSTLRSVPNEDLLIRWEEGVLCRTTDHARILSLQPDGFHHIAEVQEKVNTCPDYDGMGAVYGRYDTTTWVFTDVDADGTSELSLHRVDREGPEAGTWGLPTGRVVRETRTILHADDNGRFGTPPNRR